MRGVTVWFTGLPCSGKTTVSKIVEKGLKNKSYKVERLDGDTVRQRLTKDLGFTRRDRDENIDRVSFVANLLTRNGVVVLASFVSPFKEARQKAREEIGNFIEVFVNCPLEECIRRDVKGMYARAIRGEIKNFTGISSEYQAPDNPEIILHTDQETPQESASIVLRYLAKNDTELTSAIDIRRKLYGNQS